MTMRTPIILKVALWIQAALLLVLTSILADTNAWIGAIVTAVGLIFVVIGIMAAYRQHVGYLYFYATLVGLWEILALTHILMICGLISLPQVSQIDLTIAVIGQRRFNMTHSSSSVASSAGAAAQEEDRQLDLLKIVLPVLYGLHWCLWVLSLVCLVSFRLSRTHLRDSTIGFETQDPKQQQLPQSRPQQLEQQRPHSLESTRSQNWLQYRSSLDSSGNYRTSQHLLNFRQSVISPMSTPATATTLPSYPYVHKGKRNVPARFSTDSKVIQMPERSYQQPGLTTLTERKTNSDSNAIYIPNDPRIAQVVVTFKDKNSELTPGSTSSDPTTRVAIKLPEATTVYITNHNYAKNRNDYRQQDTIAVATTTSQQAAASSSSSSSSNRKSYHTTTNKSDVYVLNFASSGESLSDMIFKQNQVAGSPYQLSTSKDLQGVSSTTSNQLSRSISAPPAASTVFAVAAITSRSKEENKSAIVRRVPEVFGEIPPNPARIRATETKTSLTLSSDSSSSALSTISSNTTTSLGSDSGSLSQNEGVVAGLAMVSVYPLNVIPKDKDHLRDEGLAHAEDSDSSGDVPTGDSLPGMQPNSSESSHSLSSILSSTSLIRREQQKQYSNKIEQPRSPPPPPSPRPTPVITKDQPSSAYVFPPRPTSPALPSSRIPASASNDALPPLPLLHSVQTSTPFNIMPSVSTTSSPVPSTPPSPVTSAPRKPSLASIPFQYWRNRTAAAAANQGADSSSIFSNSTSSFSQTYLGQTFSKKKFQIPTIVIHPDEEDGEPPRVLSQKDIDYLSTMPPAPLRPLIQPWDEEFVEEEEYDDSEGYDYDESFHPHQHEQYQQQVYHPQSVHPLESVNEDSELEHDFHDVRENDPHRQESFGLDGPADCDPCRLDLDVDLQTLQQGRRHSS